MDESKEHRAEARYQPKVKKRYADDRIAVTWEPDFCIHAAECIHGLPGVFDGWRRPWVDVEQASPDEIADVVVRCPTGALHFTRLDGGPEEPASEELTIFPEPNGPLLVRGTVRIVDTDGHVIREAKRAALCRCGGSANKPFCDDTHTRIRFRSEPKPPATS